MDNSPPDRRALAVNIDRPFQRVLAAWLAARSYRVTFVTLAAAALAVGEVDLVVGELGALREASLEPLRDFAHARGAPLIAISPRFIAGARREMLGRQLGVDAALAKPFSREDLYAALDALDCTRQPDGPP